jgi:hypothetical protein
MTYTVHGMWWVGQGWWVWLLVGNAMALPSAWSLVHQ